MIDDIFNGDLKWLDEYVDKIKGHKFFYFFIRLFMFKRKLKYKELFLVYYGVNRNIMGERNAKIKALRTVLKIYKENNDKYPETILK